ncbi:myeloid-associated differentiation marker homolog [Narcine bancroftii]|uniref:myeloid-associated differentiation marker homolog n=1 Tax=Narcine bancroftii TaxID=1343680 RepID=UPI00383133A9
MALLNLQALTSRLGLCRLAAVLFTCLAFSLVIHAGAWSGRLGSWCIFAWIFSFTGTTLVLLLELTGLVGKAPVSWRNAPIALAALCSLLCLSASIIYPIYFVDVAGRSEKGYTISATIFSCLATLANAAEVSYSRARPGETSGYMATVPGLLKVVEAFMACVIFVFVPGAGYTRYPALQWCLAVYSICFILAVIVILLCVTERTAWLPSPLERSLGAYALLCGLLYVSATVVWPIYCFDKRYGSPQRPSHCPGYGTCSWDLQVAVACLTAFNLLVYVADLVHSGRLVFIRTA